MDSKQVFDLSEALRRTMGDADFLRTMLKEFQVLIPEIVARLEKAFKAGDMPAIGRDAHQLKGAAANLSAIALAAAAMKLEQIGKSGDPGGCEEALQELAQAADRFKRHVGLIDWADMTS